MFTIKDITVEYMLSPKGLHNTSPRFGWRVDTEERAWHQHSYRIEVREAATANVVWDSGVVEDACSDNIIYKGEQLKSCGRYEYTLTVSGASGVSGASYTASEDSSFEMGLFDEDFTADWIAQPDMRRGWASYLRHEFDVAPDLDYARAYVSGLGASEFYLNGDKVGNHILDPMITNYALTVQYILFDITQLLHGGRNALGVLLGDGWYDQNRVWCGGNLRIGDRRLRLEIHLHYKDGHVEKVLSDESFTTDYSPITLNNVYTGEMYDARLEQAGWCDVGFDDSRWRNAVKMPAPGGTMTCCLMPPIRKTRLVKPKRVYKLHGKHHDQTFIYDMGENFAGFCRIKLPYSPAGAEYVLRFAEDCDEQGGLDYTTCGAEHLLTVQQDSYISRGGEGECWEPHFTYHGFRYVEVIGIQTANEAPADFLVGYAVNTDLRTDGYFTCSDERLEMLQELTVRTILSNYHGIPEDCPVREKCGWLGDAQLVSDAAISNFDMRQSYEKYLADIATSRELYGTWQMIAPGARTCGDASPLWGCAQVVIPWNMYLYYGDVQVLDRYYPLIEAWVAHEKERSKDLIIDVGLGDWCPPCGHESEKRIPVSVSSTAEFYLCARLAARISRVLHRGDDKAYDKLAEDIKNAFNKAFYNAEAHSYGTQGADGVALRYGLVPDGDEEAVAADCARILDEVDGGAMVTGIYCNKHMVPAMTEHGYGGKMLDMLLNLDKPSFGTMMKKGATSLWECVEPYDDKGGASSLNHPMHGAFTVWFYSHILGIRPLEDVPAYRAFVVEPYIFGGIKNATGYRDTAYGRISVDWQYDDVETSGVPLRFDLKLTVPPNTCAVCRLPMIHDRVGNVMIHTIEGESVNVRQITASEGRVVFSLESGSYDIIVK